MSWNEVEISTAIKTGTIRFYNAIGRSINQVSIAMTAENLEKRFSGYSPEKIKQFFDWLSDNYKQFLSESELKDLILQKKHVNLSGDVSGESFFTVSGAKMPHGTFCTIGSCTVSEWHFLPPEAKRLNIKAKHNLLVGIEIQRWREICEQKFPVRRGKVDAHRDHWTPLEAEIYNDYLDWYEKDVKEWDEYEKSLKQSKGAKQ